MGECGHTRGGVTIIKIPCRSEFCQLVGKRERLVELTLVRDVVCHVSLFFTCVFKICEHVCTFSSCYGQPNCTYRTSQYISFLAKGDCHQTENNSAGYIYFICLPRRTHCTH